MTTPTRPETARPTRPLADLIDNPRYADTYWLRDCLGRWTA